jgi:hypothetical protein
MPQNKMFAYPFHSMSPSDSESTNDTDASGTLSATSAPVGLVQLLLTTDALPRYSEAFAGRYRNKVEWIDSLMVHKYTWYLAFPECVTTDQLISCAAA